MNDVLIYLMEASICVGISVAFYKLVLSDLTFFGLNRLLLLSILLMSLLFPAMSVNLGVSNLRMQEFTLPEFLVGKDVAAVESGFTWQSIVFMIYVGGVVVMTVHLILGFFTSQRLLGKSKLMLFQGHWIAVHPKFIPASFFRYILLPDFNPERDEQRQIVLHESMHVQLRHSWDLLLVQFAKVVFWFNPMIYQFEKSIREVHEFQADQGVTSTYSKKAYSGLLLQMITQGQGWHFMNNFNQFQTKKRIIMMSKPKSKTAEKRRFLLVIPVIAALFFVFSCEMTPEEEIEGPTQVAEKTNSIGPSNITARVADLGKDGKPVYDVVEKQPMPQGGMEGWNEFLSANLKYPAEAKQMGIEGTVIAVFVVNSDGSISDVDILRGIGAGADEEALRVIRQSPDWSPGTQDGVALNNRMRLPIRFKLN